MRMPFGWRRSSRPLWPPVRPGPDRPARRGQAPGGRPAGRPVPGEGPDDRYRRDHLVRPGDRVPGPEKSVVARVFERLERAAADPWVKAVILRLDTPGGEVTASDIVYHEVLRFKERTGRPVIGLMMSVAASGGYYIASACDAIIAHPSTLTGSIGVISIFPASKP